MNKELEKLRKSRIGSVELLDDGTALNYGAYEIESPYTDAVRVFGGVLYRTMTKDRKSVHTVFVPFAEEKTEEKYVLGTKCDGRGFQNEGKIPL